MKRIVLFCAFGVLMGCRQAEPMTSEVITLFCATSEQSKTDALSVGDAVGVFAAVEGTEAYFMENTRWVVGSDGQTLTTSPTAYYPQERQAIRFYAYLPLGGTWSGARGSFSVPTDQSTPAALKQADLCWATASTTPVATPVSLEFEHVLARLVVTTKESVSQLLASHAFSGGTLDIKTGTFTPTTPAHLTTTGNELILPAQSLPHLVLTVSGVDYTFEAPLTLPAGQTTTLNLTLNPSTKTATLAGSSVTPWLATTATGNPTQAVANQITLHWTPAHNRSAQVDKIVLSIKDITRGTTAPYTITTGIAYANHTFTVPFSSAALNYPYTIQQIDFYQSTELIQSCDQLLGATIYKSAAATVGIKDVPNAIKIGNLWWATGNLIADGSNRCKIGSYKDHGLVFQFGSLLGWKAGDIASKGSGQGLANVYENAYWGGGSVFDFANEIAVKPNVFKETLAAWPNENAANIANPPSYYFGFAGSHNGVNYSQDLTDIRDYPGFSEGNYAEKGVGDPCTYYLGVGWRTPSIIQFRQMLALGNRPPSSYEGLVGCWAGPGTTLSTGLFFVFSRTSTKWSPGVFAFATFSRTCAYVNSTSLFTVKDAYQMFINTNYTEVQTNGLEGHSRSRAQAVRCVFQPQD